MSNRPFVAIVAGCLLAIAGGSSNAQNAPTPVSDDLLGATCGEYLAAARTADPGRNPTRQRRQQAEEAQDALVDAALWVHGYQTGRSGASQPQALTRDYIIEVVGRLARYCRDNSSDGNLPLVDAARRL